MVTRTSNHATSTARDICRPLFRHRRKMILLFGTTMGLVLLGLIFLPRTYSSDAQCSSVSARKASPWIRRQPLVKRCR